MVTTTICDKCHEPVEQQLFRLPFPDGTVASLCPECLDATKQFIYGE